MGDTRRIGSIFVDMLLGQAQFDKDVASFQRKFQKFGRDMSNIGKTLSLSVTAPLGLIAGIALKTSIGFETAFAGVKKTVQGNTEQFATLEQQLFTMSKQLPVSAEELAKFAQIGGQMGVPIDQIGKFTETVAKMSLSFTDIPADEAATKIAQLANATGTPITELDRLASAVSSAAAATTAAEGPVLDMAQVMGGIGKVAGISAAQIIGISAALADVGIDAEAGGSSIQRLIVQLKLAAETGKGAGQWAELLGLSVKQFTDGMKNDATGVLTRFIEVLSLTQKSGGNVVEVLDAMDINERRLVTTLLSASGSGDKFNKTIMDTVKAYQENKRLTEATAIATGTFASKLKILKDTWDEVFNKVGKDIQGVLGPVVEMMTKVGDAFAKTDPTVRHSAEAFLAVFAVVGPLLVGCVALATFIGGSMAVAVLGITFLIADAVASFVLWKGAIVDFVDRTVAAWPAFIQQLSNGWTVLADAFDTGASTIINTASKLMDQLVEWLVNKFESNVVAPLKEKIDRISGFFHDMYMSVVGGSDVPDMVDGIGAHMARLGGNMVAPAQAATAAVIAAMKGMADQGSAAGKKLEAGIARAVEKIGELSGTATPIRKVAASLLQVLESGKKGQELADALNAIRQQFSGNAKEIAIFDKALEQASQDAEDHKKALDDVGKSIDDLTQRNKFPAFTEQVQAAFDSSNRQTADEFNQTLKELGATLVHNTDEAEAFKKAIEEAQKPGMFSNLAAMFDGEFVQTVDKNFSKDLFESVQSSIAGGIEAAFKNGDLKQALKDFGGDIGKTLGTSVFGPIGGVLGGILGDKIATDLTNIGKSSKDTIKGIGTAIDTIFPGVGSAIGLGLKSVFGGSKDQDTQARDSVQKWLEDQLKTNLDFGSASFEPGWADQWWKDAGANSVEAFSAIGEGLKNMLGITEDIGPQIGFILSENLGGNIDEARNLMGELGISAQDLEDIIIKQGIAANESWSQIEGMLQGVTSLTGEGLVGIGDLEGAFGRLIMSGGKGADAVVNLRNLAIEAMQAGATSLADLEEKLRATGKFTDQEITSLMTSLGQRGITSIEDLKDASVRVLGGVIADMLAQMGENFGQSTEQVQALIDTINSIPKNVTTIHTIITHNEGDSGGSAEGSAKGNAFSQFARGGIVNRPTFFKFAKGTKMGVMGEAGPEAIMPLTRVGGKLGVYAKGSGSMVSQDLYITVNAPNSAPGMEQVLHQVMDQMIDQATAKTLRVLYESSRR